MWTKGRKPHEREQSLLARKVNTDIENVSSCTGPTRSLLCSNEQIRFRVEPQNFHDMQRAKKLAHELPAAQIDLQAKIERELQIDLQANREVRVSFVGLTLH